MVLGGVGARRTADAAEYSSGSIVRPTSRRVGRQVAVGPGASLLTRPGTLTLMVPESRGTVITRRVVYGVVLPVGAVLILVICSMSLGPSVRAARGEGTPGVLLVKSRECHRTCTASGTFTSDDGSLVRAGVGYQDGARHAKVGDRLRALDTGDRGEVFKPSGSRTWILILTIMAMAVGSLVWWLWRYPLGALRRRRNPLVQQLSAATGLAEQRHRNPRHGA